MNDSYNRVGRSLTSYTLDQLCESASRLSRSRYHGLRSTHSVQVPHVDTPNPIRRAATLEGRTRYICITPSSTRESWLKRAQSPSVSSSPSNVTDAVSTQFPNSHSDGALMKRLAPGTETGQSVKSKSPYRTRFARRIYTSTTPGQSENGDLSRSQSNELRDSLQAVNRSISPGPKRLQPQSATSDTPPTKHISRPAIPNLGKGADTRGISSVSVPSETQVPMQMRSSKSTQFEPVSADAKPVVSQKAHPAEKAEVKMKLEDKTKLQPTKSDSNPRKSKSTRKPRLMFTRALLEESSVSPIIKVSSPYAVCLVA
ncbi:unnamed protein product [Echinostoma caproni]|uniref:Uncharacterized protein n=1 Tax=Echinostoma caproni TaxID=27848 RepID=A0A183AAC5_9TREM|nr:unnamed protein product [Echinostoma caproni]